MSDLMPVGNLKVEKVKGSGVCLVDEEGTIRAEGVCCTGHAKQFADSEKVIAESAHLRARVRVLEEALRGMLTLLEDDECFAFPEEQVIFDTARAALSGQEDGDAEK